MVNVPVVKSKLIMPQLSSSFIMLEGLGKLCKTIPKQHVVLINAPAGYGKTSFVVASLKLIASESRICWYRLEPEDKDLAMFYAHLIETLFPSQEKGWEDIRSKLAGYGDILSQYAYINASICQELWNNQRLSAGPRTFIVLDDFHHVQDSPEIAYTLRYLLNNLPIHCSVIICSRSQTEIITVKQTLENSILKVNGDDLCFSEKDLTKYITQVYKIKPAKKQVRKIMQSAEGWPAGIIIMCQLFNRFNTTEIDGLLAKTPEKESLFNYIAFETLKTIDHRLMMFLVKVAILRDFTEQQASVIFDLDHVAHFVSQCEKHCLFIQKSVGDNTTFRFHGLFREVLLQVQTQYLPLTTIESYHLKAAAHYLENKIFDQALDHFVASGHTGEAVDLIIKESSNIGPFEALDSLRLWFQHLPAEIVNDNGSLLYIKSYLYLKGDKEALVLLNKALPIFKKDNDLIMQIKTLCSIVHFYVFQNDTKNILNALRQIKTLLDTIENPQLDGLRAITDLQKYFWQEKLSQGIGESKHADSLELGPEFRWLALVYSCQLYIFLGELAKAEAYIREALAMDLVKGTEMLKGFAYMFLSQILHLQGTLVSSSNLIDETIEIGEKYNFIFVQGMGKRLAGIEHYAKHERETACELLSVSNKYFEHLENKPMQLLNEIQRFVWLSEMEDPQRLLPKAQQTYLELKSIKPGQCILEISQSFIGILAREAGEYELAERFLLESAKSSKKKKAKQIHCGTTLHLAKLYYDLGDTLKGENYLAQALKTASDYGYVMFWDLHLPTLIELTVQGLQKRIYAEHASVLMEKFFGQDAAQYAEANLTLSSGQSIKEVSTYILQQYPKKKAASLVKISVILFGTFTIQVDDTIIPSDVWKTKKIEGVLKYLILHKNKTIRKETLMELFWPAADKKAAAASLRVALYELRKVLVGFNIPVKGKESFILEGINGLQIRTGDYLDIDVDTFLTYHKHLQELSASEENMEKKIQLLENLGSIYQGNFLENDVYEDWTFFEREELKSIYLKSASSLASAYLKRNAFEKAQEVLQKILNFDPYNEDACLSLLQLYLDTNQRSRALTQYENFKNRLLQDLGLVPDQKLTSVIGGAHQCFQ